MVLTDLALARRLDRAEGAANARFVEARARARPDLGAEWIEVSGTYAMFDGVGSPLTQTFGLGLFSPPTADDLTTLETFFRDRGAEVFHEVSPLADAAHLALLAERGYRPVELTTVLHRPVLLAGHETPAPADVVARRIAPGEEARWAEVAGAAWGSESEPLGAFSRDFGLVSAHARGASCFLAEIGGEIVGTGVVALHGGVALLAGASTLPAWRRRGAQGALLRARLAHAAAEGCDLAMMGAAPGSGSQANAARAGFRVAYTRAKWHRGG